MRLLGFAGLLLGLAACASPPAPLAPTFALAASVAADLDKANREHEARVKASIVALAEACPAEPVERRRCALAITGKVTGAALLRDTLLLSLTAHYQDAKAALQAAQACRAQGDEACVEARRADAAAHLAHVQFELRVKP